MTHPEPGEIFEVPLERIVHFAPTPTNEEMARDFAKIGSVEAWAKRCGEKMQDDEQVWQAVKELIVFGTQHKDANDPALRGMQMICPTASAATFWIFLALNSAATTVCIKSCSPVSKQRLPTQPNRRWRLSRDGCCVPCRTLGRENCQVMAARFAEQDVIDFARRHGTASSTATKGDSKSSGKGKQ